MIVNTYMNMPPSRSSYSNVLAISLISLSSASAIVCATASIANTATIMSGDRDPQSIELAPAAESLLAQEFGCPRALGIVYFATSTYHISICEGQDGYLFYRGVQFSDPSNSINVPDVYVTGENEYAAVNGNVTYVVNPYELIVYENSSVIWQEPVVSWSYGDY